MILKVLVEDAQYNVEISEEDMQDAQDFFTKMDADMDRGYQMSREWVENPSRDDRCRIAADRLLSALESQRKGMAQLMAGYILSRMPGVDSVDIDISGEMQNTEFTIGAARH